MARLSAAVSADAFFRPWQPCRGPCEVSMSNPPNESKTHPRGGVLPPGWSFAPVVDGPHGIEFCVVGPGGELAKAVCQLSTLSVAVTAMSLALDAWITFQNLEGVRLAEELDALQREDG